MILCRHCADKDGKQQTISTLRNRYLCYYILPVYRSCVNVISNHRSSHCCRPFQSLSDIRAQKKLGCSNDRFIFYGKRHDASQNSEKMFQKVNQKWLTLGIQSEDGSIFHTTASVLCRTPGRNKKKGRAALHLPQTQVKVQVLR